MSAPTPNTVELLLMATLDSYGNMVTIEGGHSADTTEHLVTVMAEYTAKCLAGRITKMHPNQHEQASKLLAEFCEEFKERMAMAAFMHLTHYYVEKKGEKTDGD